MVLVIGLLVVWVLTVTALLIIWARLHIEARAAAGVDEDAYVDGREQFPPDARRAA